MYKMMGEERGSKRNAKKRISLDFQNTLDLILNLWQRQLLPVFIIKSIHGTSNHQLLKCQNLFHQLGMRIQEVQIETPSSLCRFNLQILCSDVNIKVKTNAQKLESQNQKTIYPNHFSDSWGFLTSFFQMLVFNNNNNKSSSYSINNKIL